MKMEFETESRPFYQNRLIAIHDTGPVKRSIKIKPENFRLHSK